MMMISRCAEFENRSTAERYVSKRLSGSETEEFEEHMIGCRDCQQAVRLATAVRLEVGSLPSSDLVPRSGSRRLPLLIGLAAAASIAIVGGTRMLDQRAVQRLGAVATPPPYQGIEIRSSVAPADSVFGAGMQLYLANRFDEARRVLTDARAHGADSLPASFFTGIIDVMSRQPRSAIAELAIVLRRGETPYAAEAHYYSAKAWLQLGRADSARAHLVAAARSNSPIASSARALADSVLEAER